MNRPSSAAHGGLPHARRTPLTSPAVLAPVAAGTLLVVVYAIASAAIPLPEFFPGPGVSLGFPQMLGSNWLRVSAQYTGVVVAAFALYSVALAAVWRVRGVLHPAILFGFPALFALALLWMYPPTAVDLFHYQADARTFWVYHDNPLTVPPAAHPYAIGISWEEQPSPYGPFWSLLTVGPALLPGDNYLLGLLLFKLMGALFYLGCAWLIYRIVAQFRPGWQAIAVVLFAWNPFVVLRAVGDGHNDLAMVFFALLALERAQRRDWLAVFPALALSVLVKYVTALLVPMFLLYAWEQTPGTARERLRALAPGVGVAVLVTVLCYVPFWEGRQTFETVLSQANNSNLMITSTPLLIRAWLQANVVAPDPAAAARLLSRLAFLALYVPLAWQVRRDFSRLTAGGVNALFFYLVIAAAWYRPWYMLWPVALAAVLPGTWFAPLLIVITFFGSFPDLIEQYRYNWDWLTEYWRALSAPIVVAFVPPLVVWLTGLLTFRSWHFDAPGWAAGGAAMAARRHAEAVRTADATRDA